VVKPCLLLLVGGVAAQHTTLLLPSDVLSLTLVASCVALVNRRSRLCAIPIIGFVLFQLAGSAIIEARLDSEYAGDSMRGVVRVIDFPRSSRDSITMTVAPVDDARLPEKIRLSWFGPAVAPLIGDVWEFELRLRLPRGSFNPGGFDTESWLFREKYHATGYVVPGKRNRLLWSGTTSTLDRFRGRFVAAAMAAGSDETGAVLSAVGVGARHQIGREQWNDYALTGTSHLMAISGLHVGLAAMVGFVLAFSASCLLPLRGNHYVVAVCCGVLLAAAYAFVTGFGVPARRAIIMLSLAGLTVLRRRPLSPTAVVAAAGITVFVTDPVASLTPGFHLSFGAVALLVWLARRTPRAGPWIVRSTRQLVTMQVFLMFGLLPLTALIFARFALLATPVNLVAVPVFSIVTVPLTLVGLLFLDAWRDLSELCLYLAARSVDAVTAVIDAAIALGLPDGLLAELAGASKALLLVPLAWVVLPPAWPGRRVAILGAVAILVWKPAAPPPACFDTWTLDVGQGLAVAVETRDGVALYDTGMAWRGGGSVAEQVILPFLRSRGVDRIDRLIVSHADLDHSGGVTFLLQHLDTGFIISGEAIPGVDAWQCRSRRAWWWGAVHFEVLHPSPPLDNEGNDSSCVIRVSAGPYGLLLTGDIETRSERELLAREADLGGDVVIVPHHGSLTSSSLPFVNTVSPEIAIVSAAFGNRWDFPRAPVVARWRGAGAEVLNTAEEGAIFVRICADRGVVAVARERERRRRFWHAGD
jgi:competence protein ComEC